MEKYYTKLMRGLASKYFFWALIILFTLQALWIAVSSRYPMLYDESYHVQFIQIYAQQLSPFISHQSVDTSSLGDITRLSSYLFHYLLSFPYRWSGMFTDTLGVQVTVLRFINVGFVVAGLVLYRKLFRELKVKPLLQNLVFFFLTLLPGFIYVSANVNYDNLLFLEIGAILWVLAMFAARPSAAKLVVLVSLCCLAALTMYSFLPVLFVFVAYGVFLVVKNRHNLRPTLRLLRDSWDRSNKYVKAGCLILVVISGGLFIERYGVNVVKYHHPFPDCSKVQQITFCSHFGSWERNHQAKVDNKGLPRMAFSEYTGLWLNGTKAGLLGVGSVAPLGITKPLPVINVVFVVASVLGIVAIISNFGWLRKNRAFALALSVGGFYALVLFLQNYKDYVQLGMPVAIQGRYLLVVAPLLIMAVGIAMQRLLRKQPKYRKAALLLVVMVLYLQGGGLTTYAVDSNPAWFRQSPKILKLNSGLQKITRPVVEENHP